MLLFIYKYISFMAMSDCCVCAPHVCLVLAGQKRLLGALELE